MQSKAAAKNAAKRRNKKGKGGGGEGDDQDTDAVSAAEAGQAVQHAACQSCCVQTGCPDK